MHFSHCNAYTAAERKIQVSVMYKFAFILHCCIEERIYF